MMRASGDTHRNLSVDTAYSKHVLVTVWLLNYDCSAKKFQAMINACTGVIGVLVHR